jgi:hypothetical protein
MRVCFLEASSERMPAMVSYPDHDGAVWLGEAMTRYHRYWDVCGQSLAWINKPS